MFSRKRAETVNNTASEPTPKVVDTTGNWRGNDGSWSTFWINVGDKDGNGGGQNFEVLPSTHFGVTVLPLKPSWCDDCAADRGVGTVNGNQVQGVVTEPDSSTWSDAGNFDLDPPEGWFGNTSNLPVADYGLEYVGIGKSSPQSNIAKNKYVAGTVDPDFYLGQFGLGVGATNVGSGNGQVESILYTFQNKSIIPSLSYGYTAGAKYRNNNNGVPGNLVLGGYDESRINTAVNLVSIQMPSIQNNTLVVGVQSIQYRPNVNVDQDKVGLTDTNSKGFRATIDSSFPYLWLPDDVCDRFATQFNLEYDNKTNFYTTNRTGAASNEQQNATVTFKIGSNPSGSGPDFTTINLPLAAFDLTYFDPENSGTKMKYFPIRKSPTGVFVLGRTLLQEAYIIVDYKNANFTLAQVPNLDSVPQQKLVTIHDPSYVAPSPTPIPTGGSKGLSGGAIAGIVIGILAVALGIAFGIFMWWKKRRERKNAPPAYKDINEIDTAVAGNEVKHRRVSELDAPGAPKPTALGGFYGDERDRKDLSPFPAISEMDSPPAELPSPPMGVATPHTEGSGGPDYFTAGNKLGRRGATRESSANNTPGTPPYLTPLAELPGDYGAGGHHELDSTPRGSPKLSSASTSKRDPSVTRSQNNIDEVMKRRSAEHSPAPPAKDEVATADTAKKPDAETDTKPVTETDAVPEGERRPSHTRGPSDSSVVSQPTPEEVEQWKQLGDEQPRRPLSE